MGPCCAEFVPAALLGVIACTQVALVHRANLTPWKGGGFGMFSTLDHAAFRGITVVVESANRSETIEIPPELEGIAARVAACPSDWLLRIFAESIVASQQRDGETITQVRISVSRTDFDPVTLGANERKLRAVVFDSRRLEPADADDPQ